MLHEIFIEHAEMSWTSSCTKWESEVFMHILHTEVSSHGCTWRNWSQFVSLFTAANWLLAAPDELSNKRFRISFPVASRIALADIFFVFLYFCFSYAPMICWLCSYFHTKDWKREREKKIHGYHFSSKQMKTHRSRSLILCDWSNALDFRSDVRCGACRAFLWSVSNLVAQFFPSCFFFYFFFFFLSKFTFPLCIYNYERRHIMKTFT